MDRVLCVSHGRKEKLATLLFAAGEKMDRKITSRDRLTHLEQSLKHLCREAIRNHLLSLDSHTHLFDRVPKLGLPKSLGAYALYNQSLDDNDNN